jgi:hypothetical protein
MTKRLAKKLDNNRLGGHVLSPSQEPLPPYELNPMLDNPVIRNRIGELIAKAAEKAVWWLVLTVSLSWQRPWSPQPIRSRVRRAVS